MRGRGNDRRRYVITAIAATLAVVAVARARVAVAACNTIPPAALTYQSEIGAVQQRLVVPTGKVHLVHRPCDGLTTFFDPVRTDNEIVVTFTPHRNDPTKDTTVIGPFAPDEVRCDKSPGPCRELLFTMPDTMSSALPDGLAGPARIEVTLKKATAPDNVAARIGRLSELSHTCTKGSPDPEFGHFTVLPKPNVAADVVSSSTVRATLDGHGDLLIPLDHTKAKGGVSSRALFEVGFAQFCTKIPDWVIPFPPIEVCDWADSRARIHHRLSDSKHGRAALQAFSAEGHRLAPILDHDDQGGIFGLADGDLSVLRIDKSVGLALEDSRSAGGKGPFLFGHVTAAAANGQVVCGPVKVQGARKTDDLVVEPDEQSQLVVHDVPTGAQDCGKPTTIIADDVVLPEGWRESSVEAQAGLVATVSGGKLRVLDAVGSELTSGTDAASLAAVVNRYALVVEADRVFFRTPAGELSQWVSNTKTAAPIGRASVAAVRASRVVALDDATLPAAWTYDASSGVTSLGATARQVGNGGDVAAVALAATSSGPATLSTWLWPSPGTPGSRDDTTAVVDAGQLGVTAGCRRNGGCITRVVIISNEAEQKQDVNHDGDQSDHVLRLYRPGSKTWDEPDRAAKDFVTNDRYVAFRVPEREQGADLNGDLDQSDDVLQVAAFDGAGSFRVIDTAFAATGWKGRWHELGWRAPYVVAGDEVLFLVDEAEQRMDLDGDGLYVTVVLAIFHVPSERLHIVIPHKLPNQFIFDQADRRLTLLGNGVAIGDGDRDGVLDPFDSCVVRSNLRQLDDDHDGLGDRVCDVSYCTDFVPPARVAGAPVALSAPRLRTAARRYLAARAEAENDCLTRLASEKTGLAVDADVACRGSFVGSGANPGLFWSGADRRGVARAETVFLRALGVSEHGARTQQAVDRHRYARRVIRAYGEAVNAATRVALGRVRRVARLAELQATVAEAVTTQLTALVLAMQRCALTAHAETDLAAACFGSIADGTVRLPPAVAAAAMLPPLALHETRGCAAGSGDPACLGCTTWRNAVRAVLTLLGEIDPPEKLLSPGAAAASSATRSRASRRSVPKTP